LTAPAALDSKAARATLSAMSLLDIRIGTLGSIKTAPTYLKQILPHGFESFQLNGGWGVGVVDFAGIASAVRDVITDKAVISSIGYFGNPIQKDEDAANFGAYIDNAHHFGTDIVVGFAGAFDGKPITESLPKFKQVWGDLAKRARDKGVRIAFENCDMGGWWHSGSYNVMHAPTIWDIAFNEITDSEVIGLCWEPCHQMVSLIDPIPNLRKYVKKVFNVHGKDATIAWDVIKSKGLRGGEPYVWHRHPGFGDTNWTDIVSILRMAGFKGSIDIEGWHDPVYKGDLEMTGQVHAMNHLKTCRGGHVFIPNP
jgi:sugar phosphate isomerase/epimerase